MVPVTVIDGCAAAAAATDVGAASIVAASASSSAASNTDAAAAFRPSAWGPPRFAFRKHRGDLCAVLSTRATTNTYWVARYLVE